MIRRDLGTDERHETGPCYDASRIESRVLRWCVLLWIETEETPNRRAGNCPDERGLGTLSRPSLSDKLFRRVLAVGGR